MFDVVTGAFGYTGRYIARRLLTMGERVVTLTGRPEGENPFGGRVTVRPFNFDKPSRLEESLRGATTLYNTYWIRFPHGQITFEKALKNTRTLIRAAQNAGVGRIVHVSITNPSVDSALPYFRGKALLEEAVVASNLSYAILRPTVIFGAEDILINNIAWLVQHLPVFGLFGRGNYPVQPVFVEDFADIAVRAGHEDDNVILDAVGPETYTFEQLVQLIREKVHGRARIIHVNPRGALWIGRLIGYAVGDVLVTEDEIKGLMSGLLISDGPPTGQTRLSEWLQHNADSVGRTYASELKRHYR